MEFIKMRKTAAPAGSPPNRQRRRLVASSAALALLPAVPVISRAQSGPLVVYSTTHPVIQSNLERDFTARTGIQVQSLRLASGAMAQRYISEQRAGNYACDVITLGNPVFFETAFKAGMLEDISGRPSIAALPASWRVAHYCTLITAAPEAIGYRKRDVSAQLMNEGWKALLDPSLKGSILMTDPRSNENFVIFLAMLRKAYGDDFLRALGRQRLKLVPVTQQGVQQVAAGAAKVIFPCLPGDLAQYHEADFPVALSTIPDPTFWMMFMAGVCRHSSHKEQAFQWFDYLFTPAAQQILCKGVSVSPLGNVPGALPYREPHNPDFASSITMSDDLFNLLDLPA